MLRLPVIVLFLVVSLSLRAASPLLTLENTQAPSPAGVGALAPQFAQPSGGNVVLTWVAPAGADSGLALYCSQFDPQKRTWSTPACLGPASDRLAAPAANVAPVTASRAGRMATVWYATDNNSPRMLLSVSPDAGAHFLMPVRIDDSQPIGPADVILLSDGTAFVSWLEKDTEGGAIWLRRISPGGDLSVPVLLATRTTTNTQPRLALIKDFDQTPAQILLTYTLTNEGVSQVVTRLLTIAPPSAQLYANDCNCPTGDESARGYALRGRILSLDAQHATLMLRHNGVAGELSAGTTEFKLQPELLNQVARGTDVFARAEKRGADWWLFDVRLIVSAENTTSHRP